MSREQEEELAYLREVLKVLERALVREMQTEEQERLRQLIRDIEERIRQV